MTHAGRTLDRSLVQGIAWLGSMKWLTQLASWGVTAVVARLLGPGDYGLFGMAMVYVSLAQLAAESGILAALVQSPQLDEAFAARLGGFAVMLGMALASLSIGVASLAAWFYHEEAVRGLITALSVTFVLRGFQLLPRALLTRELQFRRIAWIDTWETLALAFSTLGYALLGLGYWALVGGVVTGACISTGLYLLWRPHRLAVPRTFGAFTGRVTFGLHVIGGQLAWFIYSNADFIVVGRVLGIAALGMYTFAWTLANVAVDRVSSLVARVTPPIFAAVQDDHAALRRYVCTLSEGLALVTIPAGVGLALIADVLVDTILGPSWHGTILPLQLLAIYAAFRGVVAIIPQVLVFTGHARENMRFGILAAGVLPILFYGGARWGTTGVALVWVIVYPIFMIVTYVRYALRTIALPPGRYLNALWPGISATAVMSAAMLGLRARWPDPAPPPLRLTIYLVGGTFVYLLVTFTLHGRRLRPLLRLLRPDRALPSEPGSDAPIYTTREIPHLPRLLLISYHFPPDPAIGGLRWQKFARYAAARGWGLDVIMRDPGELTTLEPERIADLPPGIRVYGVRVHRSWYERLEHRLAHAGRWRARRPAAPAYARTEMSWPRGFRAMTRACCSLAEYVRGRRWVADAAWTASAIVERGVHRAIISSGPPHFAHLAARRVAHDVELPFVMDLRNPWNLMSRLPEPTASPVQFALTSRDERSTVSSAALVVANTDPLRELMCLAHPDAAPRIIAVPNGYDDDEAIPTRPRASPFTVACAGTTSPRPLFRGAARAIASLGLTPEDFRIQCLGELHHHDGTSLEQLAQDAGIAAFVQWHASPPRAEALRLLASAAVLVELSHDSDIIIPAQLFEYMRFNAWVFVLAEHGSATERLLRGTDVDVVAPRDLDAIADTLARRFGEHASGGRGERLANQERFSRRARAATFFDAVELVAGAAIPHRSAEAQ